MTAPPERDASAERHKYVVEHVVVAAVVGGAEAIVTENLKDFPSDQVPTPIEVLPACDFATNSVEIDPLRAARAVNVY